MRCSKYLLILLFLLSTILCFTNCSCDSTVFDYTGQTEITSELINEEAEVIGMSQVISGPFQFKILFEVVVVSTNDGLECGSSFANQIDESTLELTTDQAFVFNGSVREPGTNLFDIFTLRYGITNTDLLILIEQDFLDNAEFEMGVDHLFNFSVDNGSGSKLSGDIEISFAL